MSAPKVWFITGASSGFGLEMARSALAHGDRVVATLRDPAALSAFATRHAPAALVVLPLDVTAPGAVRAAFRAALQAFGRVDVVFANAGAVVAGEVESVEGARARGMFETNFWGAAEVLCEAVRVFREENVPRGGRLIVNSAGAGVVGYPLLGWYCASKHALEGLTETLAKEVHPDWNIKITLVEAGAFSTEPAAKRVLAPRHPAYTDPALRTSAVRAAFEDPAAATAYPQSDTAKGVERLYALSELAAPPLRLPLGPDGVEFVRAHIREMQRDVEEYAGWSEGLETDT
ncbi:uncharacterized protein BXZ73DRAFT_54209 [Epithele typhae]|uniref:uncharacterized protein n=1 Tax=Epithele typhae TaxID=378194 RepID=UPI002007B590|nr:uncharacterized protein BXZ73DRAFT_54209 [Epithele typhae]KAH9915559.1 hypothetical protein BXZ73DRAFT_54209 [Epithele typhae]